MADKRYQTLSRDSQVIQAAPTRASAKGVSYSDATSCALAITSAALGVTVLAGWILGIDSVKRIRPEWVSMNPTTAVAFVLSGLGLLAVVMRYERPLLRRIGQVAGGLASLIGILCLARPLLGIDFGVDRILFTATLDLGQSVPSRMAPNTALCFALLGASVALLPIRSARWQAMTWLLTAASGVIAMLALVGYVNGVSGLRMVGEFISIAFHTATGFALLSAGVLCALYSSMVACDDSSAVHELKSLSAIQRKIVVGFSCAMLVLSVVSIASFVSLRQFLAGVDHDDRARQVITQLANLGSMLKDAETGSRGYVISGDEAFLKPYHAALTAERSTMSRLRELLASDPEQGSLLAMLEPLVAERAALTRTLVDLRRAQGFEAAQTHVRSGAGKRTMDTIRGLLDRMTAEENAALATRARVKATSTNITVAIICIGSVLGILLVGAAGWLVRRDLTQRAAAERARFESEQRLHALSESLPQITWVARADGNMEYYNSRWFEFTGLTFEATRDWGWKPVIHPDDLSRCMEEWTHCLETGENFEGQYRFRRGSDGAYRWHLCRGIARRDELGAIVQWIGTYTDIDDQKSSEAEVKRSRAFLDAVIENIPHMVCIKDAEDLRCVLFNRAGEKLTGLSRQQMIARTDADIFSEEVAARFEADDRRALTLKSSVNIAEEQFHTPHAGIRMLHTQKIPMLDEHGEPRFLLGISEDITERQRAEQELRDAKLAAEAASRAKSEFLAHMSHEIRTPLNGVIGMTDLLLGTQLTQQQRRFVGLAKTSAESLTTVINDILDFSKIEAGKLEIVFSEFNLHDAVEEVMQVLSQKAVSKGLEIACVVEPTVPSRMGGDVDRLRQILINLVNNAIKFTERGAVLLRVSLDEPHGGRPVMRFAVTDTGIGIQREQVGRLFRAFSQADSSTTRTYGGTGLGLAISKQLVELMGGQIGVESESGCGSTFWFTVPMDPACPDVLSDTRDQIDPRMLRVLAVDGNDVHREILREQIASWGLDAVTAPDAQQALALLTDASEKQAPFRVAIVDQQMPDMDGAQLASAIRRRASINDTVLMILLSVEADIDPDRLRAMGFSGHITKPVRQSRLFDAIMDAIGTAHRTISTATRPQADPENATAGATTTKSDAKILVAEDNEVNQIVVREVLLKAGYVCEIVGDGRKAVDRVTSGGYDLVLMDCQMPVLDGFDAAREIRRLERSGAPLGRGGKPIPIVALTANAMKGDRERCLDAGMNAYTSKPIDPELLLRTISEQLAAHASHRRAA